MHPSTPLAEELENVPRGHGNNVATPWLLSGILLNPEAKRAEIRTSANTSEGSVKRKASARELIAFLGKNNPSLKKEIKVIAKPLPPFFDPK